MSREPHFLFSLYRYSKEASDQENLVSHLSFFYSLHLPLPYHVHHLESLEGSPCCLEGEKAHPWLCQSLDKAMILLDQGIEIFDLSQFHVFRQDSSSFQVGNGLGRRCVFIERPITRGTDIVASAEATHSLFGNV
jgi:hypothetical protein